MVPAVPKVFLSMKLIIASSASLTVAATTTPLPAAKPSALITMGAPFSWRYDRASAVEVKLLL